MAVTITHSTPADGTFSATGAAAWDASHSVSGLGTMAEQNANSVAITGGSISGITGLAASGANSDITSLSGLTTPLSVAQGGSGTSTPSLVAGSNISISGSWPNQTIATSGVLTGLTVNSTPTSGGAAGQIMFDTGSVLQESSALTFASNTLQINGANILGGTNSFTLGGAAAASPSAQTIRAQSVLAGTSNTAGANLTITGSQGTGTGAGGSIIFQVAPAGSSGTAQNALTTALTISGTNNAIILSRPAGSAASLNAGNYNGEIGFGGNTGAITNYCFYVNNNSNGAAVKSIGYFGFASTTANDGNSTIDVRLTRRAAANLQLGAADAAAPVAQTLSVQSVVAGTSNTAGANLTITGSQGTGTGAGGSIIFQVAPAGSSGTAQNALSSALTLAPSASGGGIITHAAGTLASGTNAYSLTATYPTNPSADLNGVNYSFTTASSSTTFRQNGLVISLNAGYTGGYQTNAALFQNFVAGTATGAFFNRDYAGNIGFQGFVNPTTTGSNTGATGIARNGNSNIGVYGASDLAKANTNNVRHVGVAGMAVNPNSGTGTGGTYTGGAFVLNSALGSYTHATAALIADTMGDTSAPVFLARINSTTAFTVSSNGSALVVGSGGLGYGTGSGGAVTQATGRTTGVTLDKTNGAITLVSAAGTTSWQSFTVTNSTVAATDTVIVSQKSGADLYQIFVTNVAAGSFQITFATTGGTTTEQPVFNFAVIKAVAA